MVAPSLEAAQLLEPEGLSAQVINARFARPLDQEFLSKLAAKFKFIFSVEEGIIDGGFGSAVENAIMHPVNKIGLPCQFIPHGKREDLLNKYGLSCLGIIDRIKSVCRQ